MGGLFAMDHGQWSLQLDQLGALGREEQHRGIQCGNSISSQRNTLDGIIIVPANM